MKPTIVLAVLALTPLTFLACGQSPAQRQAEEIQKRTEVLQKGAESAVKGLSDLAAGISSAAGGEGNIKPVDPVSFRDLIALLPAFENFFGDRKRKSLDVIGKHRPGVLVNARLLPS